MKERLLSQLRDLKLLIALSDSNFNLKPNLKRLRKGKNLIFSQPIWKGVQEYKDFVITGSTSLYAFGLIDRLPCDLDLLHTKESRMFLPKLFGNRYPGMEHEVEMTGYTTYKRHFNVDFFELKATDVIIEYEGYKFHHPYEILLKKSEIAPNRWRSNKDFEDIKFAIDRLNEMVDTKNK